ncbi:hypothetical protein D039_1359B, partial [Vibrio parahaemolyticus EKP-028]
EMAHAVVNVLEVVDIKKQRSERLFHLDVLFQQADQMGSVGQVGQRIIKRHALQLLFVRFAH